MSVDPEVAAEADLAAGFEDVAPKGAPAAEPAPAKPEPVVVPKVEPQPAAQPKPTTPEYVQITKDQFAALQAAADKTPGLEQQLSKAFGSIGNLKQQLERLSGGQSLGDVEIGPDVFAELEKDYPELAASTKTGLQRLLKNLKPAGTVKAEPDMEAVQKKIDAVIEATETAALVDTYPDWRKIVGAPEDNAPADWKADPANEFRKWLDTQPAAYQQKINTTRSARVITRAIDQFKASQTAPKPAAPAPQPAKPVDRRARIAGAVLPKGDGGPVRSPKTANDELMEGFVEG
jgi:hypothetical protein